MPTIGRATVLAYSMFCYAAAPEPAIAQSGEQGSVCVRDFSPGLLCQGTDIQVTELVPVDILDPCGVDATATLTLDVTLSAGALDRYDASFYIALNGNSALSGTSCYHDYLDPPLTTTPAFPAIHNGPWANLEPFDQNDSCGDVQGNSDVTKTVRTPLLPLQIACEDTDLDGNVDVSVCATWRNGSTGGQATCGGISDARPGSSDRCSCTRLNVLPEPGGAVSLAWGGLLLVPLARRRYSSTRAFCSSRSAAASSAARVAGSGSVLAQVR